MTQEKDEKAFRKTVAGVPLRFEPATGGWSASGGDVTVGRARTRTLITAVFVRHSTKEQVIELARKLIKEAVCARNNSLLLSPYILRVPVLYLHRFSGSADRHYTFGQVHGTYLLNSRKTH